LPLPRIDWRSCKFVTLGITLASLTLREVMVIRIHGGQL
jgi:hypothetical protein